jgi:hypothetical protein
MFPDVPDYMAAQAHLAIEGKGHIPFVVTGVEFAGAMVTTEIVKHMLGIGDRPMAPEGIFSEPVAIRLERFTSRAALEARAG